MKASQLTVDCANQAGFLHKVHGTVAAFDTALRAATMQTTQAPCAGDWLEPEEPGGVMLSSTDAASA